MYPTILATTLILTTTTSSGEPSQEAFEEILITTQQMIDKANSKDGLWRDTQKLVDQAKIQAAEDNFQFGIELLKEAQFQAESGYQQAESQSDLNSLIPYYLKP